MRAASGLARADPRELAAEMLLMLPLEADMDWLRAELGLPTNNTYLNILPRGKQTTKRFQFHIKEEMISRLNRKMIEKWNEKFIEVDKTG